MPLTIVIAIPGNDGCCHQIEKQGAKMILCVPCNFLTDVVGINTHTRAHAQHTTHTITVYK